MNIYQKEENPLFYSDSRSLTNKKKRNNNNDPFTVVALEASLNISAAFIRHHYTI